MAIIHGNWLIQSQGSCLFIWGENWRSLLATTDASSLLDVPKYPLAMTQDELVEWFTEKAITKSLRLFEPATVSSGHTRRSRTASQAMQNGKDSDTNTWQISSGDAAKTHSQIIALPTHISDSETGTVMYPVHSALLTSEQYVLQPWRVEGFCLPPLEAMKFLTSLPLGAANEENAFLGGDLRFWSQIARWSLDLLSRSKFLPILERQTDNTVIASWRSLLDSAVDSARLEKFATLMPSACLTYQRGQGSEIRDQGAGSREQGAGSREQGAGSREQGIEGKITLAVDLPPQPQELLLEFLNSTIDAQVRAAISNNNLPIQSPVREWLEALSTGSNTVEAASGVERLESAISSWIAPLQYQLNGQSIFHACFYLTPPAPEKSDWTLAYLLQAANDPEFLVDAATIWNHPVEHWTYRNRTIEQPQETLLRGLGLASRIYAPIAPSLETQYPQSCNLTPLQAYEFLKSIAPRFEDSGLGVVLPPSLANREGWANRLGLKISAQTPAQKQGRLGLQSLLNFEWKLAIGGQTLSKAQFDRLVKLNSPLVEINGEWVELRSQDIKTAQAFFTARKDKLNLSLEDALRLAMGDTQVIEKLPVVSFEATGALQDLMANLTNQQAIAALPTPATFQGQLRPYQARGVAWLLFLERWGLGACLADDMGLGKTIQFIAFLLHLKEQDALEQPTLLICPTSVLGNWEREVKKFGPTLKVLMYHGDKRPKGKEFMQAVKGHDLVITSYALVHRDVKSLQSVAWQTMVLDEAQNVKNSEAKQSKAVRELEASFRVAMTGTPVENRLQELWSILDFLNRGYLGSRQFFQRRFAMPIEKYGDAASLQTLRSLVQPFILRRVKTDREIIQDLPEKQEITVFCGLSATQAALYQSVVEKSLAEIESSQGLQRRGMILALLVKLKQICNHPDLGGERREARGERQETRGERREARGKRQEVRGEGQEAELPLDIFSSQSGKVQRLEEMLEEVLAEGDAYGAAGAGRALIFTQFAEWGKLLKPHLEQYFSREILFLYGSSSRKQREEMIDRFQHDPQGPPIMILSLKAGGVGLNLTRANHVFHFDRWWNPAVENQATDRVFRIGQTRNVQVHKFVCTGTLEEKIHEMIESKKALAEQVVGAGEEWLTEMDTDQLRNLLILDRNAVIEEDA